jgi:hypothetical protein
MTIHGSQGAGRQGQSGFSAGVSAACFQSHRPNSDGLERARAKLRINCETGLLNERDGMDINGISELLRKLSPRQEKVIRLYFGLGCQRSHSSREKAEEFGVSAQVIADILGAAQRRLAQAGLTSNHLREAARRQAELDPSSHLRSSSACMTKSMRGPHSHRRC